MPEFSYARGRIEESVQFLSVNFWVDIRVGTRKDTLELLKKAGCDVVGFGVETGSDKLLKEGLLLYLMYVPNYNNGLEG